MPEQVLDFASLRIVNDSAVYTHALECSKKFRAGKFTRVGSDFYEEIHADVEAVVRELRNKWPSTFHEPLDPGEIVFTTGVLCDKIQAELNRAIARLIQNKVQRQPSCGCTLRATR